MIEYMRRLRAIAFIGPPCTGKTTILKIVSNALNIAFGLKMRTSVVNPAIYSSDELYGSVHAFEKEGFNKGGVFQIILDVFERERLAMTAKEKTLCIQSIFFDSCEIQSTLTESLIDFLHVSNKRERETNSVTEFLLDVALGTNQHGTQESIPVTMPNSNVVMFPHDLYLFFETTSLKQSSPAFISRIGLVLTEPDDLEWVHLSHRQMGLFLKKHRKFFEERKLANAEKHLRECFKEFLEPFITQLAAHPKVCSWPYFNAKSGLIQFFSLLNSVFYRYEEILTLRQSDDDSLALASMLLECERDVFWSSVLLGTIWGFGAALGKSGRKAFEELFFGYRRKFNINIGGPGRQRFTLFDIYYDQENLSWDLLQEKLEYKLKLQYDPVNNILLIPCVEVSQAYFLMDMILGSLRYDDTALDKHFRVVGPSATSKTIAVTTFMKRFSEQYQAVQVPMSAYLTFERLKSSVESYYQAKRRNLLEPVDKDKKVVLMIDDLHLRDNVNSGDVLEFLRTWCMSKGYYDLGKGFFKNIGQFGVVMAENSEYRKSYCKLEGR